jgi:hypothetical protein
MEDALASVEAVLVAPSVVSRIITWRKLAWIRCFDRYKS